MLGIFSLLQLWVFGAMVSLRRPDAEALDLWQLLCFGLFGGCALSFGVADLGEAWESTLQYRSPISDIPSSAAL
jgi:hypothetical protein